MNFYKILQVEAVFLLACLTYTISSNLVHRRFEYKYSFKPPYLAQKDGSVPFWEYGGNAIASSENVRIAPSLRSQKGAIWTKVPVNFDWWEIDIAFRITGRGRIGADGLAFWYTKEKGAYDGEVFGSSDKWNGLGIIFDSFDNDNKHNNPYIMGVVNDGTKEFDHKNDGTTQLLAGCLRDFRNKPFPTRARIEYYQNVLTVLFNNGMTNNDQDYEMCFRSENVILPKGGYFGVSAATGGLADDHDVIHFLTASLHSADQVSASSQVSGDEQKKLSDEYQEYQRKLQQQKDDYRKDHPEAHTKEPDLDDWFETDSQRELGQIFQGQSKIFEVIKSLDRKLDEIVGRQERTLSLVSQQLTGAGQYRGDQSTPPPVHSGVPGSVGYDTIRRHEVDMMFSNQNQVVNAIRELREFIIEIRSKAEAIITNQAKQPTAQVQSIGYDSQSVVTEVRDGLNVIKSSVSYLNNKLDGMQANTGARSADGCPKINCVSVTSLLVVAAVHLVIILAYSIYRDSKGSQAKKFY